MLSIIKRCSYVHSDFTSYQFQLSVSTCFLPPSFIESITIGLPCIYCHFWWTVYVANACRIVFYLELLANTTHVEMDPCVEVERLENKSSVTIFELRSLPKSQLRMTWAMLILSALPMASQNLFWSTSKFSVSKSKMASSSTSNEFFNAWDGSRRTKTWTDLETRRESCAKSVMIVTWRSTIQLTASAFQ